MDNLKKGDYGRFHFFTRAKSGNQGFDIDNDEIEYYVRRSDIDSFKEAEKPELKIQELNK